ncbi:MAG: hypothetical protein ACI9DC_002301 [Gammaproteobacteria bacterium]
MQGEKYDLLHGLPEHRERIRGLKTTDNHFARSFDEHHNLDHEIRRIEQGVENTTDEYLEGLKYQRLHHKDPLLDIIKKK